MSVDSESDRLFVREIFNVKHVINFSSFFSSSLASNKFRQYIGASNLINRED